MVPATGLPCVSSRFDAVGRYDITAIGYNTGVKTDLAVLVVIECDVGAASAL